MNNKKLIYWAVGIVALYLAYRWYSKTNMLPARRNLLNAGTMDRKTKWCKCKDSSGTVVKVCEVPKNAICNCCDNVKQRNYVR